MAKAKRSREQKGVAQADTRPFDINLALRRVAEAVRPYPKAALFELADAGYGSVFEILVACILSIRTRDETSLPAAKRLFAVARTPAAMSRISIRKIDGLIADCTFHQTKADQISEMSRRVVDQYGGELPCDPAVLMSFEGVGPKCANLTLGIACGRPFIGVDVHVHRVTNRWGYVQTTTPEKTMVALQEILPKRYWVKINALLVPFGKHVCTGTAPKCSTCPVLDMCRQVGVTRHR